MSFADRAIKAEIFEREVHEALQDMGFESAINGTEHTHPEFVGRLHQSTDPTSLSIRFQPDGVTHLGRIPRSFYWEAKSANSIERNAYTQYMKLHDMGNIVILIFDFSSGWRWCFIENTPLEDGNASVAQYPPKLRFPVKEGWIAPREGNRKPKNGSGTSYRYVIEMNLSAGSYLSPRLLSV